MSRRRKAREMALQVLYAVDLSGVSWENALEETITRRSSREAGRFVNGILDRLAGEVRED